jgi:hypothetical protein
LKKCHEGPFQVIPKDESELFGINKENIPINPGTKFFSPTPEERQHGIFFSQIPEKGQKANWLISPGSSPLWPVQTSKS